jgi:hypothetical protein
MLRNINEIFNYVLLAKDGEIGRCRDFLYDDEKWTLRYIIVNTRNWLPGRSVLVSPQWTTAVDWAERKLWVDLSTDSVKNSPEYDHLVPLGRDYERALHDYYGRHGYWQE